METAAAKLLEDEMDEVREEATLKFLRDDSFDKTELLENALTDEAMADDILEQIARRWPEKVRESGRELRRKAKLARRQ